MYQMNFLYIVQSLLLNYFEIFLLNLWLIIIKNLGNHAFEYTQNEPVPTVPTPTVTQNCTLLVLST